MAVPLDHGGMNDQVMLGLAGDAPVQAPFKHGKCLAGGQGRKGRMAIRDEVHLRPEPATQAARRRELDMEVGVRAFEQWVIAVEQAE